jgi:hypothetical protein
LFLDLRRSDLGPSTLLNLEPGTEPGTCELGTCELFNNPLPNLKSDNSAKKMLRKMGVQNSLKTYDMIMIILKMAWQSVHGHLRQSGVD